MNKEEIIKQAIKQAKENGCKKYHGHFAKDWDDAELRAVVFDPKFAKALGYALKDLGIWCDKGKDPIDYIKKLFK